MAELTALNAISPIDGRYWDKVSILSNYFSEFGFIKYRVLIEVEYFISLVELPLPQLADFQQQQHEKEEAFTYLRNLYRNFSRQDALRIKAIEAVTNHDVKAVEYFLKEHFDTKGWQNYKEFIHFGLTSQDINNTAIPLALRDALHDVFLPSLRSDVLAPLIGRAEEWRSVPMLARTHGQPATPTLLGKEIFVFVERLRHQIESLEAVPHAAKFGGATGNLNAHYVAFPNIEWREFADRFTQRLGLRRMQYTTQIEHYDHLAAQMDAIKRINTILTDLTRDFWTYISMDYFHQKVVAQEVGSSAMPHKVNPIDFENAEGNFGLANAMATFISSKLPVSRLQRDLTDSTVLRNLGVPFAHSILAYMSLNKGLGKLVLNRAVLEHDLEENWAVVSEALQTILRRERFPKPYEALKALTRVEGAKITQKDIHDFIETLAVSESVKEELRQITPFNYVGRVPPSGY